MDDWRTDFFKPGKVSIFGRMRVGKTGLEVQETSVLPASLVRSAVEAALKYEDVEQAPKVNLEVRLGTGL